MWIRSPVLEKLPTLTKTGVQRWISHEIIFPSDVECWFDMAQKNDLDGLNIMLNKGFQINTKNHYFEHLGLLACRIKSLNLLRFFVLKHGDIFYSHEDEYNTWQNICSSSFGLFYFKQALLIDTATLLKDRVAITQLLASDKNINKIKYWCSYEKKHKGTEFVFSFLKKQLAKNSVSLEKTPKIYYYLSGKEQLFYHLHRKIKLSPTRLLRKI